MFFSSAINASEHILRKSALLVEKMKDLGAEEPVHFQLLNRTFCITLPRKSRWMQAQAVAPADPSPMCRVEKEQSLKEHFPLPCFWNHSSMVLMESPLLTIKERDTSCLIVNGRQTGPDLKTPSLLVS